MQELLRLQDLAVEFDLAHGAGGVLRAVDGVSFRVPRGKIVALVGESGSGKSVIGQAIMGLLPRNARIVRGDILFDHDMDKATPPINIAAISADGAQMRGLRGRHMSIIFQEPMTSLSPLHTIGDQVAENLHLHLHRRQSPADLRARTLETLQLCGFADPARAYGAYPFELSGGMRQRAMIAMALICRPSLLIADEPTTALDVTIQAQILKLIKELQSKLRMGVLMITHDLGVVANMADEIVVLYQGKILEAGAREDIFRKPGHPYLLSLLGAVPTLNMPLSARLKSLRDITIDPVLNNELTGAGGFSSTAQAAREFDAPANAAAPLLQVRQVRKRFTPRRSMYSLPGDEADAISAVEDVSFDVRRGECVALVGESGCGKTTLAKMLLRIFNPDQGSILFEGKDIAALQADRLRQYRRRVQFIFQDPFSSLNPRMTILDTLTEPLLIHKIGTAAERRDRASGMMQLVGLDPRFLNRYPHSFSGGQRQRIGIARALALRPDLLICDEPVSALDVSVQAQILNLLKDLQAQLGLTYLFISHNLAVVRYVASRILVMCQGRLVESGSREDLFENPMHPYTQALLAAVPVPDVDAPLNFSALTAGRDFGPLNWPEPFRLTQGVESHMSAISASHFVRVNGPLLNAAGNADKAELGKRQSAEAS